MGRNGMGGKISIEQVKARHELDLLRIEGVQGVGVGLDEKGQQEVIKVYVNKKTPLLQQRIPSEIEGFPVDVEVSGEFRAF
jgi:hypothetical protein